MRTATALARLAATATVAAAVVTACGSSAKPASGPAGSTGTATASTITIKSFQFSQATVKAGSAVTVVNQDQAPHSVQSSGGSVSFDSKTISGGGTGSFTAPTAPGNYAYICGIHNYMKGTLKVVP